MKSPQSAITLGVASLVALACFAWPFILPKAISSATVPVALLTILVTSALVIVAFLSLNGSFSGARMVALLGVLIGVGVVLRFLGLGFAGVEPLFVLLIIAGRALGPAFGFTLGATVLLTSSLLSGMLGPWLPFQMFAAAWVGMGAGLLPSTRKGWSEIGLLAAYGAVSAYAFGLIMNFWFWPFAVGSETSISFDAAKSFTENLVRFVTYSLVTSTLTWDTVRAVVTVTGIIALGAPMLATLRRSRSRGL